MSDKKKDTKAKTAPKEETKAKQPAAGGKKRLPALIETAFTISMLVTVLVGVATALLSYMAGCDPTNIILRAAVATLSVGFITFFFSYLVARGAIQTVAAQTREATGPKSSKDISA